MRVCTLHLAITLGIRRFSREIIKKYASYCIIACVLTWQIWVILIQMHPLNIKCTQRAAEAQFFMPDWENAPNK